MDETTTTDNLPVQPEGGPEPQPTEAVEPSAEVDTSETQAAPATAEPAPETDVDENVAWLAESKGVDLSDPDAMRKVAAMYRNAENLMHKATEEKRSVQEAVASDPAAQAYVDPYADSEVTSLKRDIAEERFFRQNPKAETMRDAIIEKAKENPELAASFNLKALYKLALADQADAQIKEAEERGRKAALAELQRNSAAVMPSGNASAPAAPPTGLTREAIANMSADEYISRRAEIAEAERRGLIK